MFCSKQVPNITTITLACYVHPYSSFLTLSNYPQTIVWHTQIVISKSHYSSMAALLCCIHGKAAVITEDKEQLLLIYNSSFRSCDILMYIVYIPYFYTIVMFLPSITSVTFITGIANITWTISLYTKSLPVNTL